MRVRAAATALAFLAVSLIIGGCVLLDPPPYDFTGTSVRYQTGRATMTIDGEQIVLDRISTSSQLSAEFGPEVYWYNEEGWGLRLSGGGTGAFMPAMISIDRVRTTYWSAIDYGSGCRVTLSEADETGVKGSATCTGLRWSEMLRGGWEGEPYVEGEAPFDATVEFQAAPKTPGA